MLDQEILSTILDDLRSEEPSKLLEASRLAEKNIPTMNPTELREVADALTSLFYIDTMNPDYVEAIDAAVDTLAKMGADTVDVLIEGLTDADLHANYLIAQTLGKIGAPAVAVLKDRFRNEQDPFSRALALFAMSKIDDPALIEIMPEIVSTLDHEHPQLRDTAVQAVGAMIECIGGVCLSPDAASAAFDKLMLKLADIHHGTRAKAVKSIGQLAVKEYLDEDQVQNATDAVCRILGLDEQHDWDRAFIVRKAAEETYYRLTGEKVKADHNC